jgi:hypothetical protein
MSDFRSLHSFGGGEEKRVAYRWNIPIDVNVKGRTRDGTEFDESAITADVSSSGMSILLSRPLEGDDEIAVSVPGENFKSLARVIEVVPVETGMYRTRVNFPGETRYTREGARKRFVYDYALETWAGYILDGDYYDHKNRFVGSVEGNQVVSPLTGKITHTIKGDRVFSQSWQCVGHLI